MTIPNIFSIDTSLKIPKVAVLLAAYNGISWIEEQVESILDQINVACTIFISVDLSTDSTYQWCCERSLIDDRIVVLPYGEVFGGAANNFFRLIRDVNFYDYDYISLSDQDDIWYPEKLDRAIFLLTSKCCDAVSSNVVAFWSNGKTKPVIKSQHQRRYDYYFEAAGPGCTYVFKSNSFVLFKNFISNHRTALNNVSLHDWLIYAYFRHNGLKWYIDDRFALKYRQHDGNQFGSNTGLSAYLKRINLIRTKWYRNQVLFIQSLLGNQVNLSFVFMLTNFLQLRRRFRDSLVLLLMFMLGFF